MKAVLCDEYGPIDVLKLVERPDPVAAPGEVVVDIAAAGVNFPDGLIVGGAYQVKPPLPFIPGGEAAGVISAVGADVAGLSVGQRVIALCALGAFAEKVAIPAAKAIPLPDRVRLEDSAAFSVVYGTAIHALQDKARLEPGETVFVLGAAGGIGMAAIQVAKAMGARVVAAASSDAKVEAAKNMGADVVLNYTGIDLKTELRRLVPEGIDVIVDPVGGPFTEPAVRNLKWGGRLLIIGFAEGTIPKLPINLLLLKEAEAIGVFWGQFIERSPDHHRANLETLLGWLAAGRLKPVIGDCYPLADFKTAIERVMSRNAKGKVIITMARH